MDLFASVWELYLEKKIREAKPLVGEKQELPTQSWESFTSSLDEVSHFDPKDVYSLNSDTTIDTITNVISQLTEAEQCGELVVKGTSPSHTVYGHLVRLVKAKKYADSFLEDSFKKNYSSFVPHANKLYQDITLSEFVQEREQANKYADKLSALASIMEKRNVFLSTDAKEHLSLYQYTKELIQQYNKEIAQLEDAYQKIPADKTGLKELKKIRKRITSSVFRLGLRSSCQGVRFKEGVVRLDFLLSEIDVLKNNVSYFAQRKSYFAQANSALKNILESNPTPKTLQEAVIKYSSKRDARDDSLYLHSLAKEYVQLTKALEDAYAIVVEKEQSRSVPKIVHVDFSNSSRTHTGTFSLNAYLYRVGEPENFSLSLLTDSLNGLDGGKNWTERFMKYQKHLSGISLSEKSDYSFLEQVSVGLRFAINEPDSDMDVSAAQKAYDATVNVLNQYVA